MVLKQDLLLGGGEEKQYWPLILEALMVFQKALSASLRGSWACGRAGDAGALMFS